MYTTLAIWLPLMTMLSRLHLLGPEPEARGLPAPEEGDHGGEAGKVRHLPRHLPLPLPTRPDTAVSLLIRLDYIILD